MKTVFIFRKILKDKMAELSITRTNIDFPSTWKIVKLKDLGDWKGGGTPKRSNPEYWENGEIPWVTPKEMKRPMIADTQDKMTQKGLSEGSAKLIQEKSLLMVMRSGILEHTFPTAINTVDVTVNQDLKAIIPNNQVDVRFLKYFFEGHNQGVLRQCSKDGTTVASINTDKLKNLEVPIPPKNKQKKIVQKIESLFSKLDAGQEDLQTTQTQLERYRKSVLKAAVEGKLTEEWRERNNQQIESAEKYLRGILGERSDKADKPPDKFEKPNLDTLPELPRNWTWSTIDQLGKVMGGLTKNKDKRADYPIEVPYLRVANVYENELRLDKIKKINVKESELERVLLKDGDLLVVEGNGSEKQIGRVAIWDGSIDPCAHQNHLHKVRLVKKEMNLFVLFWLLSARAREHILRTAKTTSGLYTLSMTSLRQIPVPLPPKKEIKEIEKKTEQKLSVRKQVGQVSKEECTRVSNLRQSILKKAFEGRLT